MSGQGKYRELWQQYYENSEAAIFVVDASDKLRIAVAKNELDEMLAHPHIKSREVALLVFANKMDIGSAMTE